MLTVEERKNLQSLLAHAVNPEEALTLDQLEGYLFGIVITPDVTRPNEWFTDIFGESLASFADDREANAKFAALTDVYNRLNTLRLRGQLLFPFDLERADPPLDRLRDWAVGFNRALSLRSWIWMPEEVLAQPEMAEDDEEIMTCLMVVLGVAHPDQIPEIFDGVGESGEDEQQVWTSLVGQLPLAVEMLQAYAEELEDERLTDMPEQAAAKPPSRVEKTGRNEPCSCGSGKKFKKCCGLN